LTFLRFVGSNITSAAKAISIYRDNGKYALAGSLEFRMAEWNAEGNKYSIAVEHLKHASKYFSKCQMNLSSYR